jgi:hypothetical protein
MYKIRCRIVHRKREHSGTPALLPTDPEIAWLRVDLEVLEFIASKLVTRWPAGKVESS